MKAQMIWSRGELETLDRCPACNKSIESKPLYKRYDDENIIPDEWNIYRCNHCQSFFVNPRPTLESLPALYQDYLTHRTTEIEPVFTSNSLSWKLIRGFLSLRLGIVFKEKCLNIGYLVFMIIPAFRHKLDRFGRNLILKNFNKKGKLLDLGCGAGEFLNVATMMGWDTYGCDFDPVVVKKCRDDGFDVRLGGLEAFSTGETFDVITMNQVIEHVANPQKIIKDCYQALNSEGYLWIGTPNPNAAGARFFGAAWVGLHPPYHLCIPSQNELIRWLNEAGFEHYKVLQRGTHAKFNWIESTKLAGKLGKNNIYFSKANYLKAELVNMFTPKNGEETVIIAFKK
jgi:2-polyprenyl-3-methyl-5-hydroxy-6-metoxy-1,4-benzoquinol methylase